MSAPPIRFAADNGRPPGHVPEAFICPLTHRVMSDPHRAANGVCYEYRAIRDWLSQVGLGCVAPGGHAPIHHHELVPNHALRGEIARAGLLPAGGPPVYSGPGADCPPASAPPLAPTGGAPPAPGATPPQPPRRQASAQLNPLLSFDVWEGSEAKYADFFALVDNARRQADAARGRRGRWAPGLCAVAGCAVGFAAVGVGLSLAAQTGGVGLAVVGVVVGLAAAGAALVGAVALVRGAAARVRQSPNFAAKQAALQQMRAAFAELPAPRKPVEADLLEEIDAVLRRADARALLSTRQVVWAVGAAVLGLVAGLLVARAAGQGDSGPAAHGHGPHRRGGGGGGGPTVVPLFLPGGGYGRRHHDDVARRLQFVERDKRARVLLYRSWLTALG